MKKITSVILAVLLCFSLALTAMAVGGARYIVDEGDRLTASELSELEGRAEVLYDRGGIGASCLIVDSLGVYTAPEYIDDVYADNCPASDAVVLLNEVESGSAYLYYIGDADSAVLGHEAELLGAYNNEDTYFDGIYEFIDTVAEIVLGDSDLERREMSPRPCPVHLIKITRLALSTASICSERRKQTRYPVCSTR